MYKTLGFKWLFDVFCPALAFATADSDEARNPQRFIHVTVANNFGRAAQTLTKWYFHKKIDLIKHYKTMRKIVLLGLITLIFTNCNSSTNQKIDKKDESSKLEISNSDKGIDFKDLVINGNRDTSEIIRIKDNCVFIIQMTTNESDSLENVDPDSYEAFSENANNAAMNTSDLFDRLKIKSIWSDKRYIDCEFNGKNYLLDTRLKNIAGDYCILFKKDKKPVLIEIELLTEEILNNYFK